MKARTRARGWALQTLYAWETRNGGAAPGAVLAELLARRRVAQESREHLARLVDAVEEHREEIDDALQRALLNWRLERLSRVDRNILRLAAAEMMYLEDVPPLVAIQEAIVLAEKYGTDESPRFVNGVLDALMKRLQQAPDRGGDG